MKNKKSTKYREVVIEFLIVFSILWVSIVLMALFILSAFNAVVWIIGV